MLVCVFHRESSVCTNLLGVVVSVSVLQSCVRANIRLMATPHGNPTPARKLWDFAAIRNHYKYGFRGLRRDRVSSSEEDVGSRWVVTP